MELFSFTKEMGREIRAFGSNFVMSKILKGTGDFNLGCMYFGENKCVGRHDAVTPQLFLVVQGEGWVSGENGKKYSIQAGEAAFWEKGESHEAGSATNMVVFVVEGETVNPSAMQVLIK